MLWLLWYAANHSQDYLDDFINDPEFREFVKEYAWDLYLDTMFFLTFTS